MELKKTFEVPLCEITYFTIEDVIAASSWDTEELGILDINNIQ